MQCYVSAVVWCLPVCPSICLSRLCIVSKWLDTSSNFLHLLVASWFRFVSNKRYRSIPMEVTRDILVISQDFFIHTCIRMQNSAITERSATCLWLLSSLLQNVFMPHDGAGPGFLPRNAVQVQLMPSCGVTICPSIRPSRSWILPKQVIISSNFFHHQVAKPFYNVSNNRAASIDMT